jgi:hypothetical protein
VTCLTEGNDRIQDTIVAFGQTSHNINNSILLQLCHLKKYLLCLKQPEIKYRNRCDNRTVRAHLGDLDVEGNNIKVFEECVVALQI